MVDQLKKAKLSLDEARLLVLGAQILLGFQFRSFLEADFGRLPVLSQKLRLVSLGFMLLMLLLVICPTSFHELAEHGRFTARLLHFATSAMSLALPAFVVALGIDVYTVAGKLGGNSLGIAAGGASAACALFFWFGWEYFQRVRGRGNKKMTRHQTIEPSLHEKIDTVLTECRVVIPGSQALLGFQLIAMLMEGFDRLPRSSQYIHLASLLLLIVSMVLLMAPAAYHRIVELGEDSERLWRFARVMLLSAMAFLAAGVAIESFVVVRAVTHAVASSIACAAAVLIGFYGLWFAYPYWKRTAS